MQAIPSLPCLNSGLLPYAALLTKPECNDTKSSINQTNILGILSSDMIRFSFSNCKCPKRCNLTEYRISFDPSEMCGNEPGSICHQDGHACLYFSFPSTRVRFSSVFLVYVILSILDKRKMAFYSIPEFTDRSLTSWKRRRWIYSISSPTLEDSSVSVLVFLSSVSSTSSTIFTTSLATDSKNEGMRSTTTTTIDTLARTLCFHVPFYRRFLGLMCLIFQREKLDQEGKRLIRGSQYIFSYIGTAIDLCQ